MPGPRPGAGRAHRRHEGRVVADRVVGGQDQHQGLGIACGGVERRDGDRGGRIAPARLEQDVGLDPALGELLGDEEAGVVRR